LLLMKTTECFVVHKPAQMPVLDVFAVAGHTFIFLGRSCWPDSGLGQKRGHLVA
jgi:hypothetical protein